MTKVAIYARYSTDMQSASSIEDQIRLCEERALADGHDIANCYTDHGISGASMLLRPGVQQLIQDGMAGKYDLLYAEALDRLSRDQEDIAAIYKRLTFMGITIATLSEGQVNEMHIGLKGTMNAIFLKDLADKTRRGLRGKVENGKSGGGITYGYDVVKKLDQFGEPILGERKINAEHAAIVKRIFTDYAAGISPKAIAQRLNKEGIAGPTGKGWGPSTIYGNRQRGTGIINNELYIGQMVWNRQRYVKNPDTGKRISRLNPENEWIRKDMPELRIIDQELWDSVKERQGAIKKQHKEFWGKQRPKHLFSYLLKCGECGGGYSKISKNHYGCSTARNKGTCDNRLSIHQDVLEGSILNALQSYLMDEKLCKIFCEEYTRHLNMLRSQHNASLKRYEQELKKLIIDEQKMIQAICDGFANEALKEKMHANEARQKELKQSLEGKQENNVLLHPGLAEQYRREVSNLAASLNKAERRQEAADLIRSLIEKIVLTPNEKKDGLTVDLYGDLAGILSMSVRHQYNDQQKAVLVDQAKELVETLEDGHVLYKQDKVVAGGRSNLDLSCDFEDQNDAQNCPKDKLVAGVGFEPTTFRL